MGCGTIRAAMVRKASILGVCVLQVGCSHGTIGRRFFSPDAKHLVWVDGWGGYLLGAPLAIAGASVKVTDCGAGKTRTIACESISPIGGPKYLSFVPDSAGDYILLMHGRPHSERGTKQRVTLVRINDGKRWELPPLPDPDQERWHLAAIDLKVESTDEPRLECTFFYATEYPSGDRRTVAVHKLSRSGWSLGAERNIRPHDVRKALEALDPRPLRPTEERTTPSPDGRYLLYECLRPYKRCVELRAMDGSRVCRLTTQTDQLREWYERNVLAHFLR